MGAPPSPEIDAGTVSSSYSIGVGSATQVFWFYFFLLSGNSEKFEMVSWNLVLSLSRSLTFWPEWTGEIPSEKTRGITEQSHEGGW